MIHILVMLHAGPDGIEGLRRFESKVIPIMKSHGGRLLSAFTPKGHELPESPDEIHLITFPSEDAFQAYRNDPGVTRLHAERAAAISKTSVYVSMGVLDYGK